MRKFLKRLLKGLGISFVMMCLGAVINGIFHLLLWFNPILCLVVMLVVIVGIGYSLAQ